MLMPNVKIRNRAIRVPMPQNTPESLPENSVPHQNAQNALFLQLATKKITVRNKENYLKPTEKLRSRLFEFHCGLFCRRVEQNQRKKTKERLSPLLGHL